MILSWTQGIEDVGVFIELRFGVYIPDADLTVENMDTLDQVVQRILEAPRPGIRGHMEEFKPWTGRNVTPTSAGPSTKRSR